MDSYSCECTPREAVLVYTPDPLVTAPTVLKVPVTWLYPGGFNLQVLNASKQKCSLPPQVSPEGSATWSQGCCDLAANTTVRIALLGREFS